MIKLSASMMHCSWNKERVTMLNNIIDKLGDLSILNKFYICDDINKNGTWYNCKRAWENIPDDSTHHIVLQDDMMVCNNFLLTLYNILQANPTNIINIFASNNICNIALNNNKHWYTTFDGSWGGAVILPRAHFNWCSWADNYLVNLGKHLCDTRLNYYAIFNKLEIWNTAPGLIEHIGYDKSLIGHSGEIWRKSCNFINNEDPLLLDWTKGLKNPEEGYYTGRSTLQFMNNYFNPNYRPLLFKKLGVVSKYGLYSKNIMLKDI